MLTAGVHAVLGSGEHLVHVHQREHGEGSGQRAGLDGDATPQQRCVARLVQQGPDHHLHVGEESSEDDPGDDLQETRQEASVGQMSNSAAGLQFFLFTR